MFSACKVQEICVGMRDKVAHHHYFFLELPFSVMSACARSCS